MKPIKVREEVEKLDDTLELASLLYLSEKLTSPTKEIGMVALAKQIEGNEQIRRERKMSMCQVSKNAETSTVEGRNGSKNWPEENWSVTAN